MKNAVTVEENEVIAEEEVLAQVGEGPVEKEVWVLKEGAIAEGEVWVEEEDIAEVGLEATVLNGGVLVAAWVEAWDQEAEVLMGDQAVLTALVIWVEGLAEGEASVDH